MALCLASCGKKSESTEGGSLEPIPTAPTHTGKSVKGSPFVGTFLCSWSSVEHSSTDDDSWSGRISEIEIKDDGTFTMTFDSLSEGEDIVKATVSGTLTVKDDTATCTVKERSSDNFLGSDVETFTLVLMNEDEFRYRGDQQGMVGDRDVFSRSA